MISNIPEKNWNNSCKLESCMLEALKIGETTRSKLEELNKYPPENEMERIRSWEIEKNHRARDFQIVPTLLWRLATQQRGSEREFNFRLA